MPAVPREGFIDSLQQGRLTWLSGTAFPAAPVGTFLGLYGGTVPLSDGSAGAEIAIAARPAVVFAAPVADGSLRWYVQNSGIVTFTVPAATPAGECVGFGIFAANAGGTPNFWGYLPSPFPFAPLQVLSIPVGAIKIFSERVVM